jgi:hypothetical protein
LSTRQLIKPFPAAGHTNNTNFQNPYLRDKTWPHTKLEALLFDLANHLVPT